MIPFGILFGLLLVLTLVVLFLCTRVPSRTEPEAWGWQSGTRFFLVLLRLAIGWHFLVEGIDKVRSPSWSGEAYLRESIGPFAPLFRELAGDTLKDRLTVGPDRAFPDALGRDWDNYLEAFTAHYNLTEEQAARAKTSLAQQKKDTVHFLTAVPLGTRVQRRHVNYAREATIPEIIAAYEALEEKLRVMEADELPKRSEDALPRYREMKAEIARIRSELRAALAQRTAAMKTALLSDAKLTPEQTQMGRLAEPIGKPIGDFTLLDWSDQIVKWGTLVVGVLLLAGLFTRTACVAGAMFLLLFFVALPPLPGYPESPRAEGHYLWINKNVIEMLALLVLATTRSGRWVGLDGLVAVLRTRSTTSSPVTTVTRTEPAPLNGPREPASSSKEMSHGT